MILNEQMTEPIMLIRDKERQNIHLISHCWFTSIQSIHVQFDQLIFASGCYRTASKIYSDRRVYEDVWMRLTQWPGPWQDQGRTCGAYSPPSWHSSLHQCGYLNHRHTLSSHLTTMNPKLSTIYALLTQSWSAVFYKSDAADKHWSFMCYRGRP